MEAGEEGEQNRNAYPSLTSLDELFRDGVNGQHDGEVNHTTDEQFVRHKLHTIEQCKILAENALNTGDGVLCVTLSRGTGIPLGPGIRSEGNGICASAMFNGSIHHMSDVALATPWQEYYCKGNILNGHWHGQCEFSLPIGKYTGRVHNGLKHGHGVLLNPDGTWYDGQWQVDRRHGHGKHSETSNVVYDGQWQNDVHHGIGKMTTETGSYEGSFVNGARKNGRVTENCLTLQTFEVSYDEHGSELERKLKQDAEIEILKKRIHELESQDAAGYVDNSGNDITNVDSSNYNTNTATCKVCLENPITKVLRPCNHACICEHCETRIKDKAIQEGTVYSRFGRFKCPICRTMCRSVEDIILS